MRALIGASIFSAAGSLPFQVLPFLILSLVSEGRVDVAYAGWVGSAYLIGMLSSTLLLPLFKVSRLSRRHALGCIGAIAVSLGFSISTDSPLLLLAQWFVVGFACGCLQFLGATAAAASNNPQAFALRLAVALIVASGVIIALGQFGAQRGYSTLAYFLLGAFGLAALLGTMLYHSIPVLTDVRDGEKAAAPVASALRSWSGLMIAFAFFAGQPGFWAYAVQSASQRGLDLRDAAFVIAASKTISALVLLYFTGRTARVSVFQNLLVPGIAVGAGILVMTYSAGVVVFFLGFLLWELALNILSARLQGVVVAANPGHAGVWITGAILLGAATGPIVHGAAIGVGIAPAFVAYAALSGLFPFLWSWSKDAKSKVHST